MSDPKLPNTPHARRRNASNRNEWVAADRLETRKTVGLVALVAVLLVAGIWLIISGLSR